MRTKTVIGSAFLLVLAVLVRAPLARSSAEFADTSRPELRAIAALNDCIQERFRDIDEKFGISRIARLDQTPHRFAPENVREMDAVRLLEQAGVDAVMYLAGRRLLAAGLEPPQNSYGWSLVKGPVQITKISTELSAPRAAAIRDDAREALIAFGAGRSYEFGETIAGWTMVVRPIRASDAACLKCHRERSASRFANPDAPGPLLRVGDPLGIVVYGYKSAK